MKNALSSMLIILAVLAAAYTAGYFVGSESTVGPRQKAREFSAEWQASIYRPMARAESVLIGMPVELWYPVGGPGTIAPFSTTISCTFGDAEDPDISDESIGTSQESLVEPD